MMTIITTCTERKNDGHYRCCGRDGENKIVSVITSYSIHYTKLYDYDNDGKIVGNVIPQRNVFSLEGKEKGRILYNGKVVAKVADEVGKLYPDGSVGKREAFIIPRTAIVDSNGNVVGFVAINGDIISKLGDKIGRIMPEGYAVSDAGKNIGGAAPVGVVLNKEGNVIGSSTFDAKVIDYNKDELGVALPDRNNFV